MRWCYEIEHDAGLYHVSAWIDGRPGLGHKTHRRRQRAMKLAEADYLSRYPVAASEVVDYHTEKIATIDEAMAEQRKYHA